MLHHAGQSSDRAKMNILLLGSGGREHALAWKMAASPLVERLWCAPGNAGIANEAEIVALDIADHAAVVSFCRAQKIGLVVVGPEAPLCAGIVDDLVAAGVKAFGPSKAAAQLEGSKGFTKDLCRANNIPTAAYERFTSAALAKAYVRAQGAPIVVKADGLAAGKGVVVAQSVAEPEAAIVMIVAEGPKLIEYNERFGDPECQVIMLRLMSDLVPALLACCDGMLGNFDLRWYPDAALTVVMAAKGYPGSYSKGSVIEGLDVAATVEGVEIFHAGTEVSNGNVVANGGRVLNVCAIGSSVAIAQARAYQAIDRIHWSDGFFRHDIGWQAIARESG